MKKKSQTESECFAENALFARKTMLSEALIFDGQRNPNVKLRLTNFIGNRVFFVFTFGTFSTKAERIIEFPSKVTVLNQFVQFFQTKKKQVFIAKVPKTSEPRK